MCREMWFFWVGSVHPLHWFYKIPTSSPRTGHLSQWLIAGPAKKSTSLWVTRGKNELCQKIVVGLPFVSHFFGSKFEDSGWWWHWMLPSKNHGSKVVPMSLFWENKTPCLGGTYFIIFLHWSMIGLYMSISWYFGSRKLYGDVLTEKSQLPTSRVIENNTFGRKRKSRQTHRLRRRSYWKSPSAVKGFIFCTKKQQILNVLLQLELIFLMCFCSKTFQWPDGKPAQLAVVTE